MREQAPNIAKIGKLETWRESLNPPESAWWWYFQPQKEIDPWDRLDWLWNSLAAACLGLTASFTVSILQAVSVNGVSWAETFATLSQGAGLALLGGGLVTTDGQEKVRNILNNFHIPERFQSEAIFGASAVVCLFTYHQYQYFLPDFFYTQGVAAYEKGDLSTAAEKYQQAMELDPDEIRYNLDLGKVYESVGKLDHAIAQYEEAISVGDPEGFNNLGRLYIHRFDPEKKRKDLIKAETLLRLGLQRARAQKHKLQTPAEKNASHNIRYQLHRNLGWVLLEEKKYAEAEAELKRAIELDDKIEEYQMGGAMADCLLAEVYQAQGDAENARIKWQDCQEQVRPETLEEYSWFIGVGQRELADCIDTSSVVTGLDEQLPTDFADICENPAQLFSAKISTSSEIEALRIKLLDILNANWNNNPTFEQDLVYLINATQDGEIVDYQPLSQLAGSRVSDTPLSELLTSISEDDSLAQFKVTFSPTGKIEITSKQN
ncbi:MAG: tetratricopeptide repeat protein [Oscillatoria sp. PMC 1068.18]|nr:tetratricopeptide repeat protein [Oscillatoria sp. PMC 1076.18]MEC4987247.1 tetratricopeptide repeat protein [Oscillatoria sp. PMC 1068.18]